MRIGIVGIGIIGSRMAKNWQKAGHTGKGWNRTRAHAEGSGTTLVDTPAALARESDLIMIVVADPPALDAVVSGPNGIASTALKGKVVLNASTVSAQANQKAEAAVNAAGGEFLETPFTGSKAGAETAKLIFFVGGSADLLRRTEPVLLQVGAKAFHFGAVGKGADTKLAMNLMLANIMQSMAEGFAFAQKAGLDMGLFVEAFRLNAGWSGLAEMKVPKMLQRDFSPHFSLKHMDKDVRLAVERARELGATMPQTEKLKDLFTQAMRNGWEDDDFSVIYRTVAEASGLNT